ncbi:unnamed protein product [Arabidopsis lyrata]|nr:unnamed protein product [Arabidopsis lyrata]
MRIFILGECIIGFSFKDCFERPISSGPDAWFDVFERYSNDNNKTLKRTTKTSRHGEK